MPQSLIESFNPVLKVSKIFGILSTPQTKYKPIYGYGYILLILILLTAEIINSVFDLIEPIYGEYTVLQATDYIQVICGYIVVLCFYYKSVTGSKKMMKIFNRLDKIDELFALIEISFDYEKIPKRLKVQLILATVSVFICGIFSDTSVYFGYLVHYNFILCSNLIHQIYLKYQRINKFLLKIKNGRSNVSLIYKATKCYEELNDVTKSVNNLFGLTNLMSIS